MDRPVLAVDIGGTKQAAAVVEPGGRLLSSVRIPTDRTLSASQLWRSLTGLLDRALAAADVDTGCICGIGVGCSGPMAWPQGRVSPLNIPAWRDFPLRERIAERYPDTPVRVHNDAVCMAIGEHWRGAGRDRANMLGMVVSTGVGGGLVLGGQLVNGRSGNAGHVGHLVVDPEGAACPCGGRGCLETVAAGPALLSWATDHGWQSGSSASTGSALADDAARGHPVAGAALRRAGRALGIAVASAEHLCDLDVVVVGGGLSQAGPLVFDPLEEARRAHTRMPFTRMLSVVPAALGQEAGVVGAAALVFAGDRYWKTNE